MDTRRIFTHLNITADANPISDAPTPPLTPAAPQALCDTRFNPSSALADLQSGIDRLSGLHGRLSHMLCELEELVGTKSSRK